MLLIRKCLAMLLLLAFVNFTVAADKEVKLSEKKGEPAAQPGWILVEEDIWVRFIDEPSQHMQQAHDSFLNKEFKATTSELRKAGGGLHVAARNATNEAKAILNASANELDTLAKEIQADEVKSVTKLDAAFARAEHALAVDHHVKSQAALLAKQNATAGHYLHSAVVHVENAAKWSGHELESAAIATAGGIRTVAGKLVEGSGFVVDETGRGLKWVGDEIEKLGKFIEPHKQPTPITKPVTKG